MNRRGTVALTTAISMTVLIGFSALAVDTTRAWLVESRLKTAIDAASLVAARRFTEPTRDSEARATFWAQFSQGGNSHTYLGATVTDPVITPDASDASRIRLSATATIPTTLFGIISNQPLTFADYAVAQRTGTGLELAIVIDQTSSMGDTFGGMTKLAAAKSAVQSLLGILYGNQDIQGNLWVSIVPFARTINIGTQNSIYLIRPIRARVGVLLRGPVASRQYATEAMIPTLRRSDPISSSHTSGDRKSVV